LAVKARAQRPQDRGADQQRVPRHHPRIAPIDEAGVHEQHKPEKADRRAGDLRPADRLRPQEAADRYRPKRHRIGKDDRPPGGNDGQADDAADEKPGDLELADPEQAQPLAAGRQQALPGREQRRRQQGEAAGEAQQHEGERRHLADRKLHQRPVGRPG